MQNMIFTFLFGAVIGGGLVFQRTTKQIARIEQAMNSAIIRRSAIEREQY